MKMKTLVFLFFFTLTASHLFAQATYTEAMRAGDQAFKNKEFKKAINDYFAAEAFDESKKEIVKQKINLVFAEIEKLRQEAEVQKNKADEALQVAETAKEVAVKEKQNALNALNLADAMQRKVEIAMFDKAVKARKEGKEWLGFAKYNWEYHLGRDILDRIDSLDLSGNSLLRIPYEVLECKNLKHLNLLGNPDINWKKDSLTLKKLLPQTSIYVSVKNLDNIPKDYWGNIKGVEILTQGLNVFPKNILGLKQIDYLKIRGYYYPNNLEQLPNELFEQTQLKTLILTHCKIGSISKLIGNLKSLTSLDLSSNQLTSLPSEIWSLKNLTSLNLGKNQLTNISAEIGNLKNLKLLDLSQNQLTSLPPETGRLERLTDLDLRYNKILSLPCEIWNIKNLTSMYLGANQLTTVPNEIRNLKNLISLDLSSNQLTSLPSISSMKDLNWLNLKENQLRNLTADIGDLKSLTSLDLSSNNLINLPSEIGNLKNLTSLDLQGNDSLEFTDICNAFSNYEKKIVLTTTREYFSDSDLNLDFLSLKIIMSKQNNHIPKEIGNLKNLVSLNLHLSKLTSLPLEVWKLKNLISLNLSYNRLTSLPPEIGSLENLAYLNLSRNALTRLPKEISSLKNLKELDLADNGFQTFPDQTASLPKLENLDINSNYISSIPVDLKFLSKLKTLDLRYNPLLQSDIDRINQLDIEDINNYLFCYSYGYKGGSYKKIVDYYLEANSNPYVTDNNKKIYGESFFKLGNKYLYDNKYDSAIIYYNKSIELKFISYTLYNNMGICFLNKKEYKKSISCFNQVIKLNKNSKETGAWSYLVPCYLFEMEYQKAENAAKQALLLNPEYKFTNISLAIAYLFQGKYESAKMILNKIKNEKLSESFSGKEATLYQLKMLRTAGVIPFQYEHNVDKIIKMLNQ